MSFHEDLASIQSERQSEREKAEREQARLQELANQLEQDAIERLIQAAQVLEAAGVEAREAQLAHKQRQRWQWPTGRARTQGWILQCGDHRLMLRQDGWLAAVHECSDSRRTLCACPFTRMSGPLPSHGLHILREPLDPSVRISKVAPGQLAIRMTTNDELTDYGFNSWLAEQVAVLLEAGSE